MRYNLFYKSFTKLEGEKSWRVCNKLHKVEAIKESFFMLHTNQRLEVVKRIGRYHDVEMVYKYTEHSTTNTIYYTSSNGVQYKEVYMLVAM